MKYRAPGSLAALAILLLAPGQLAAQTRPSSQDTVDLMELFGIDLPEGEALQKLIDAAAGHPLGSTDNPVRASGSSGQRAYLARLRCADGRPPEFERAFNAGMGPFGRIVDAYNVSCGAEHRVVFLDMYHDHVETRPVQGFDIAPPAPPSAA